MMMKRMERVKSAHRLTWHVQVTAMPSDDSVYNNSMYKVIYNILCRQEFRAF